MRTLLSILIVGTFPALALAAGEHTGGHNMSGHNMANMHKESETHDSMAGVPGDPANVSRTIDVVMDDTMRFEPKTLSAKSGETIRFLVKNEGKIKHEMVIGSMDELKEHAEMMRKMPNMKHVEANMITLNPGQRGRIVWRFDKPGTVNFACLVPGHMEAGMIGEVMVK